MIDLLTGASPITFLHPDWLYLAVAAPFAALLGGWWSGRRMAVSLGRYGGDRVAELLGGRVYRGVRRPLLLGLALTCLGVALAGPMYGQAEVTVRPTGADVVVALDVSLSMAAVDIQPSRMARATYQVEALLEALPGYRVGLVVFSGSAYPAVPLTLDHGAVALFLDAVQPGMIPRPGSSLQAAVEMAGQMFGEPNGTGRALLVLSDGETTAGSVDDAVDEAEEAGMTVFAVGVGEAAGGPIPITDARGAFAGYKRDRGGKLVTTRLQPAGLQALSKVGGGAYYASTLSGEELTAIADAITTLAQGEQDSAATARQENRYQWPLGAAVLLLLVEAGLVPFAARRRVVAS